MNIFKRIVVEKSKLLQKISKLDLKNTDKEALKTLVSISKADQIKISGKKLGGLIGISERQTFNVLKDLKNMKLIKIDKSKNIFKPNTISIKPIITKLDKLIKLEEKYFGLNIRSTYAK